MVLIAFCFGLALVAHALSVKGDNIRKEQRLNAQPSLLPRLSSISQRDLVAESAKLIQLMSSTSSSNPSKQPPFVAEASQQTSGALTSINENVEISSMDVAGGPPTWYYTYAYSDATCSDDIVQQSSFLTDTCLYGYAFSCSSKFVGHSLLLCSDVSLTNYDVVWYLHSGRSHFNHLYGC